MDQLPTPPHGTRARYQLRREPCRCTACRQANAAYQLIYRRTGEPPDHDWHEVTLGGVDVLQGALFPDLRAPVG